MTNAESQDLAFIHYRELVQRESNDEVFHDQTGYWIWDKDADWQIIQSPFMGSNAKTLEFRQTVTIDKGTLTYSQTTVVDIYGKRFEHTDDNELNVCD